VTAADPVTGPVADTWPPYLATASISLIQEAQFSR
jgi:hypothetical protein